MSPQRLQFTLITALFLLLITGIAAYIFRSQLPYIFISGAALALLIGGIVFHRQHKLAQLPLKAHKLAETRLAHEQEIERKRLDLEQRRVDTELTLAQEKQALELQVISERWQLEQHVTLTRVSADPKGFYPYLVTQDGLQHLPNPHMINRQIAAPVTSVTEEDEEDMTPRLLPALVRYDDIRSQVPSGHTLLGVGLNGLETRAFSVLSTCWIVGGSKTGKTNTVALKVEEAYNLGCYFCVIDPHRYKDDSLFNSIQGYRKRFLQPGVATTPEEILAMLKAFLREAQARLSGQSKNRRPIILLMDEVGHVCDTVGLEGDELAIAQEIIALLKKISRMCGQELRGYSMFGWFISQAVTGLAWLRRNAMTVIAHKVLMMSERKLACNEDMNIARSMDNWPIGRILVYGLDFPDGCMTLQQPIFTPRIVDADPPTMEDLRPTSSEQTFTPGTSFVNTGNDSVNERETAPQAVPLRLVKSMSSDVNSYQQEDSDAEKKVDTSKVGDETRAIIVRLYNTKPALAMGKIADAVGLNGRKYLIFQAVCKELGIETTKKKAEA